MRDLPLSRELKHGRPISCEARHEGDEFACACGMRWGVDDPNPPPCKNRRHVVPPTPTTSAARKEIIAPDEPIKRRKMPTPEELTDRQLDTMAMALAMKTRLDPQDHRGAMRAAYRVLLDSLHP